MTILLLPKIFGLALAAETQLPSVVPAVIVEELAGFSAPEGLDEALQGCYLTQPGLIRTQATPRGAKSIAALRITMFTAAFELR